MHNNGRRFQCKGERERESEKKKNRRKNCAMCAFVVVGIIMYAHFSNRLNALVLHTVCTEAIVYHLHCGNYFINKTLCLYMHKERVSNSFANFLLLPWFDVWLTINVVRLRETSSVKSFYSQLIYRYTRFSLTQQIFFLTIFSKFLHIFLSFFLNFAFVQFFQLLEHICF